MKSTASIIAAAVVVLASCGGGGDDGASTTAAPATATLPLTTTTLPTSDTSTTTSTSPPTSAPTSAPSTPSTSAPAPLPPTTPAPAPAPTTPAPTAPTTTACVPFGGTEPVEVGFGAGGLSTLVGTDIRTGAHDCFERVVIELGGTGTMPGYTVRYATGEITLGETGDQYVDLRGDAELLVVVQSWMGSMEDGSLWGEQQIFPTNVQHVLELRLVENWEGHMRWGVGLDRERAFRVSTLAAPPRIVIDIVS